MAAPALQQYLQHESRVCRLEATMANIDRTLTDIKTEIKEVKTDLTVIEKSYRAYFWKVCGGMMATSTFIISAVQFAIPHLTHIKGS